MADGTETGTRTRDIRRVLVIVLILNWLVGAAKGEETRAVPLDRHGKYSVNAKALERWSDERLSVERRADGTLEAIFRYEGTTCSNLGRALRFPHALGRLLLAVERSGRSGPPAAIRAALARNRTQR